MDVRELQTTASSIDIKSVFVVCTEGLIVTSLNIPVLITILANAKLRCQKEFVIFAFSMLLDSLFGLTYFYNALIRIVEYYTEEHIPLYTSWMCFTEPYNIGYIIITPWTGLFCLAISIDRFISVYSPVKYWSFSISYSYLLSGASFLLSLPTFIISGIECFNRRDLYEFTKICNLQNGTIPMLFYMLRGIRIVSTTLAALLYLPILIKIYYVLKQDHQITLNNRSNNKLLKMTITIAMITANQLLMFVLPDIYILTQPNQENPYSFIIMNLNKGVINMLIFLITQRKLRNVVFSKCFTRSIIQVRPHSPKVQMNRH